LRMGQNSVPSSRSFQSAPFMNEKCNHFSLKFRREIVQL
jgi:hypothetical protein